MTARLADRAARIVGRLPNRRSFLKRSAMVSTALAVAPTDFVLRPNSAYAAICNCSGTACQCGSLCCDGYTEFCCTMTGTNACPQGTVAAGWWKADGSAYCAGPRYYIDCNATCRCGTGRICPDSCSNAPWGCGCARGDCNNRKAGCTQFRYGQCNQQLATVGRIACRVVSCDPAVLVLGNCAATVAVDNSTANHNQPCLQAPPQPPPAEENMDTLYYSVDNFYHAWWIDTKGNLQHNYQPGRVENMTVRYGIGGPLNPNIPVRAALNPQILGGILVWAVSTQGWIVVMSWDMHKWTPLALGPK